MVLFEPKTGLESKDSHGSSSVMALVGSTFFVILPRFFCAAVSFISSFLDPKLQDRE